MEFNEVILEELQRLPIFGVLNDLQLKGIISSTRKITLPAKTTLFSKGTPAESFYAIHSGQIKLYCLSDTGQEKVVEILHSSQSFGEAIMFMPERVYPVSAEAINDSELYSFNMTHFRHLLEDSKETCFRLLGQMSKHLHAQINEINNLTLHNATYRFARYLLEQLPKDAMVLSGIELSTPKNIIASRLSIQPETFSRILYRMSEQGLIQVKGHDISLLDVDGLQKLL